MRQHAHYFLIAVALSIATSQTGLAQNPLLPVSIYLKSDKKKSSRVAIATESIQGIKPVGNRPLIPAAEIDDVDYADQMDGNVALFNYRPAVLAEKTAQRAKTADERIKQLNIALDKYKTAQSKVNAKLIAARRHIQYKIGYLNGVLGLELNNKAKRFVAISALKKFNTDHPDSWQFTSSALLLAKLHAAENDFTAAATAVKSLADSGATDQVKQDAQLMLAELLMDGKKYTEAQKTLQVLITNLPKGNPARMRARLAEASCLAATGGANLNAAITKLKKILDEIPEKRLRGVAYNTLGECYFRADQLQEARWQFLWVDVIYNQDKSEHAKALYHLWQIFRRLREFERSQEFYNTLLNTPAFANSEWRRRAIEDAKKLQQ